MWCTTGLRVMYPRVESGLYLLTHLTYWPTGQSGCDRHMTHLWPICDPHIGIFFFKVSDIANMTWKFFDMEQCHGFLHSWWDTKLVSYTDFLKIKSLDTRCFKTAWDNKLPIIFRCIYQTQSSLTHQMPTLFSKEHLIVIWVTFK